MWNVEDVTVNVPLLRPAVGSDSAHRGELPALFQGVCGIKLRVHDRKFVLVLLDLSPSPWALQLATNRFLQWWRFCFHQASAALSFAHLLNAPLHRAVKSLHECLRSAVTSVAPLWDAHSSALWLSLRPVGMFFFCDSSPVTGKVLSWFIYLVHQITLWGNFCCQYSGTQASKHANV